jgi:hypothetical protein
MADPNTGTKKTAPAPPDYMGLANQQAQQQQTNLNQQTAANRPNQSNPFATSTWQQGPDGQWSQSTQLSGPLAGLNQSLQQQAAQSMGTPFSLAGLPQAQSGDAAREQAINAAYGSATSRLDPMFQQREEATRTHLLNAGFAPGSEGYNREMEGLGRERNDAYSQALSSAIGQGTAAGNALFQQGMQSRQQALEEMLRQRGQAFGELGQLGGLTGMQGFNAAGQAQAPNLLQAGSMQDQANYARWQQQQQQLMDIIGSGMQLAGQGGAAALPFLLSDERAKVDVQRLEAEAMPGVAVAVFRYKPGLGMPGGRHVGIIAQDVARVMPRAVRRRPDGLLEVHPAFAPISLED